MLISLILTLFLLLHLLKMPSNWFHMNLHSLCNLYMLSNNYQHMMYIRYMISNRFLNSFSYMFLYSQYMRYNLSNLLSMFHCMMYSYLHRMYIRCSY